MNPAAEYTPLLAILVSFFAIPLIWLSGNRPNVREFWTLLAAVLKFALVLSMLPRVADGGTIQLALLTIAPGASFALRVDAFGLFFALIASGLWILTSCFSIGYMRGAAEKKQTRYFASFALSLSATMGIAFSANLLTFIIFYELLTLATWPLVIHKESAEAISAGRKYLAYALTAGVLLIAGAAWVGIVSGSTEFEAGGIAALAQMEKPEVRILFLMLLAGVGVKSAIMPLHSWLPEAMVAPTPVSALLHAVAVVKSGVFGVVRVSGFVFGPELMRSAGLNTLLAVFAGATILCASLIALRQDSLKRRLAFSTVAHLSYIALGAALLTPEGFTGGLFHIATHATMKITLFFCAGAIYVHLHKVNVSELNGVGRAMPWTMGAFAVGSIGLAGLPPVNGFVSKWWLCLGSAEAGWWVALAVFLTSGLLNAAYFFPILHRAFFRDDEKINGFSEASPWMVVPLCATALAALVLGLFPNLGLQLFQLARLATQAVFL